MSNIHGLFSGSGRHVVPDDGNEDEDNRYVGGIGAQGGGSGLAVQPNPSNDPTASIFSQAEQTSEAPSASSRRRTITMYRSGFVVDDGPYRRLNDPANSEFLTSLAQGRVPRELAVQDPDNQTNTNGPVEVGLIDKRKEEYVERFTSFTGAGESLGSAATSSDENAPGVIIPPTENEIHAIPPPDASSDGITSVQIRLLSGKRLVLKILRGASVSDLGQMLNGSGLAGKDPYVLVTGFPPKPIVDLKMTIEDAGLAGASVQQKKA